MRRAALIALLTALSAPLLLLPTGAGATSFMLAPGAPTPEELAQRIAAREAELRARLTGRERDTFEREMAEHDLASRRAALHHPPSDAHRYGLLERRWAALQAWR